MIIEIKDILSSLVAEAVKAMGLKAEPSDIILEHPADLKFGDYSTNIALKLGQKYNRQPKELATEITEQILKLDNPNVDRVEVAGPGFINFYLAEEFLLASLKKILEKGEKFGKNNRLDKQKTIVEYTDPNPFKEFHIGHLMSNTIGEAISRIVEANGAEVKRACYQGDVGMHVAKAIWGIIDLEKSGQISDLTDWDQIKKAYAYGAQRFEIDTEVKKAIYDLNKKIYERSDQEINEIYDLGRQKSLEYFETVYARLGTKFDFYFYESQTGTFGRELVLEWLDKGVFTKSDGAIIFEGEKYGLHTRVFINSEGLPTYEAKELGLAKIKYDTYPYDQAIVVTGNEIDNYFKVLLKAMSFIFPDLAVKIKHLGHGMLRLPSGKMSSRTGEVITAESLLDKVREMIVEKMETADREIENFDQVADQVSVAAVKYSILKQDTGKDIIFDFDKSLSFSGNSGPYLQYAYARTQSILEKAQREKITGEVGERIGGNNLEKLLYRFPEVVARAGQEFAPHHICTYLFEVAETFSSYYAVNPIVTKEAVSAYRVALTEVAGIVLKNGLNLLGIKAPREM
jgi:arginyl-tRNA synthetase